jgi:hypothetical protein
MVAAPLPHMQGRGVSDNRRHPGHNRQQMAAAITNMTGEKPLTVRCAHCPNWGYHGPTRQALAAQAEHHATNHPPRPIRRKSLAAKQAAQTEIDWRAARAGKDTNA